MLVTEFGTEREKASGKEAFSRRTSTSWPMNENNATWMHHALTALSMQERSLRLRC